MGVLEVIEVPFSLGGSVSGSEYASDYLIEEIVSDIFSKSELVNAGKVEYTISSKNRLFQHINIKELSSVLDVNKTLLKKVKSALLRGNVPLVIGGDHSISWGSISAVLSVYKEDFTVFYIDAHGDINTSDTSQTHNAHGMHMAYLLGLGEKDLSAYLVEQKYLLPSQLKYFATRSLDSGEECYINDLNISVLYSQDITNSEAFVLDKVLDKYKNELSSPNVHISLDIDCLDPDIAPGTGVPEKNGISLEHLIDLINGIKSRFNIISVDLVEYNPHLDIDNKTKECCLKILKQFDDINI